MESQNPAIERYYNKKKKRKKRRKFMFYTLLFIFFVTVITVLSLTVFFNISDIAVTENAHYSDAEIIKASGLEKGQNLFTLNKFKIIEKMKEKLPYVREIVVDRHLPVGIEFIITETKPYMYIEHNGGYYLLDETLKVLDRVETQPENLPAVTGVTPQTLEIGKLFTAQNSLEQYLVSLSSALKEHIGDDCVTALSVLTLYDINFEYMGRVTVKVGTLDNIEKKLQLVKYVLDENKSNETAQIDVSSGVRAYYRAVDERGETVQTQPEQTDLDNDGEQEEKEE